MAKLTGHAAAAIAASAAGFIGLTAWGQTGPARAPVLHEDLPAPSTHSSDSAMQPVFGASANAGETPAGFADKGKILPKPDTASSPTADEPVYGADGFAADRDTEWVPDAQTGPDSTLRYVTVFNPSVLPFKRMSTMDAVRDDYTLYTATSSSRVQLETGHAQHAGRDLFWGSLAVRLRTGEDIPIPSVAPDMRILSYEVSPKRIPLTFSRDGADNFYVRTDEPGINGEFRLVFLADADARHFGARIPRGYRVSELASLAQFPDMPPLPRTARSMANRGLHNLRVHRGMMLKDALDKLVYYFRAFEAKKAPAPTGDIYWDLFMSQAGVCRHRSFAFMITANALGIPTRYVTNEAHAWVEVWVPEIHWLRVDLGGAALRMQVSSAADKTIYRSRQSNDLPQPASYANNYTKLEGDIKGLSQSQLDEAKQPVDPAVPDLEGTAPSGTGDDATGKDKSGPDGTGPDTSDPHIGPGKSLPAVPDSALVNKVRTQIRVDVTARVGYRGETMRVSGRLTQLPSSGGGQKGVSGQRVDIYFAPAGAGGDDAVLVGFTVTEADGIFSSEIELPRTIDLITYEVFAATDGDAHFSPAVSD